MEEIFKNGLSQTTGFHFASTEVPATSSLIPINSNRIEKLTSTSYVDSCFSNSVIRDRKKQYIGHPNILIHHIDKRLSPRGRVSNIRPAGRADGHKVHPYGDAPTNHKLSMAGNSIEATPCHRMCVVRTAMARRSQ